MANVLGMCAWHPRAVPTSVSQKRCQESACAGAVDGQGALFWLVSCLRESRVLPWASLGFAHPVEIPGAGEGLCKAPGAAAGSLSHASTSLCQTQVYHEVTKAKGR